MEEEQTKQEEKENYEQVHDSDILAYEGVNESSVFDKERQIPINQLDSAWLSAEPDYRAISQILKEKTTFSRIFEIFSNGFRLANLSGTQVSISEYDFRIVAECFDQGIYSGGSSFLVDIASRCEFSQGKGGFRSKMMNTIRQISENFNTEPKKNVFGKKEDF